MKKTLRFSLLVVFTLQSCASIDKYNSQINKKRSVLELQSDINFTQRKLVKLHPDLYHYITKEQLDFKFDSLRSSITDSMNSNDFYFKLSPVIASIRQGHTQLLPLTPKLTSKQKKTIKTSGLSPLSLLEFELIDNKLIIVKNNSKDSTIKRGTELQLINGVKPQEIFNKFQGTFSSDGFNSTFIHFRLAKGLARYYYQQNGLADSIKCRISYNDSVSDILIKRPKQSKAVLKDTIKTKEQIAQEKKLNVEEKKKRRLLGYDALKKSYSKQLSYPVQDSSIALLKIADFIKGNYRKFYKQSFKQLNTTGTKTLIIDLRNNTGGRSLEVSKLYSYLAHSSYRFIDKSEVTSKTSLWYNAHFSNKPIWLNTLQILQIPSIIIYDTYAFLTTKKRPNDKFQFALSESRLKKPSSNNFKGKIYVLINGGSFSASSLLSSNLKGTKRATYVGQETGGAYNGCVAGIMPERVLANSKLRIIFGQLLCETHYKSELDGRGILPDKKITPTIMDRVTETDPELEWILNDISSTQSINN